jgi:uncharacterized protein YecT (DUF1311 family)
MRSTLRVIGTVALVGSGAFGCAQRPGVAALSPEAAVQACEAPAILALRSLDGRFESVALQPAAASRIERRALRVGSQPVGMVVAGQGTVRLGPAGSGEVRYVCLLGPDGRALFADVEAPGGSAVLAECGTASGSPSAARRCLEDLLRQAERGLAEAEAAAIRRARGGESRAARAEVEQPVVASIGAWRVYRDAECARRRDADPQPSAERYEACRVALTRDRVGELGI